MNPCLTTQTVIVWLLSFLFALPNFSSADMIDARKALSKQMYSLALKELHESAEIGNREAQYKLAVLYLQGQTGKVDKVHALAWMTLAAERGYPNAVELAKSIYHSIPEKKRAEARKVVDIQISLFGKTHIDAIYYPVIHDIAFSSRIISQPAKLLKRDQMHYNESTGSALSPKTMMSLQSWDANVHFSQATRDLLKTILTKNVGHVLVQYDVDMHGIVKDVEVIFEYPQTSFTEHLIQNIYSSKFYPAKNTDKKPIASYSLVIRSKFGSSYAGSLKSDHPAAYSHFRRLRRRKGKSPEIKYQYARSLRAYEKLLPKKDREAFEIPLLESAKSGLDIAQLSYAEYQIYERQDFNSGLPWLFHSASAGLKEAEYRLGDLLLSPSSAHIEKDTEKAKFWLRRAAKKSHPIAVEKLASIVLDKPDKESVSEIAKLMEGLRKKKIERATYYYYKAKIHDFLKQKKKAKKSIKKCLALAKHYNQDSTDFEVLAKRLNN